MMRAFLLIHVLLVATMLVGCTGPRQPRVTGPARAETYSVRPPQAVLDSEAMGQYHQRQARTEWAANTVQSTPWWVGRNDGRLNVRAGADVASASAYAVRTYDVQQSYGDRIYNIYRRELRSVEWGVRGR